MNLKPCPWCGSKVNLRFDGVGNVGNGLAPTLCFQIRCPKCKAMMGTSWPLFEVMKEHLEGFEKRWNEAVWDEEKGIWRESDES